MSNQQRDRQVTTESCRTRAASIQHIASRNQSIPLKNDGVLSPKFAVWHQGDNPNDKVHNWYYGDSGDGGYNDLELMRYKRTYTQGANRKGQLERPMDETRKWLVQKVL